MLLCNTVTNCFNLIFFWFIQVVKFIQAIFINLVCTFAFNSFFLALKDTRLSAALYALSKRPRIQTQLDKLVNKCVHRSVSKQDTYHVN